MGTGFGAGGFGCAFQPFVGDVGQAAGMGALPVLLVQNPAGYVMVRMLSVRLAGYRVSEFFAVAVRP